MHWTIIFWPATGLRSFSFLLQSVSLCSTQAVIAGLQLGKREAKRIYFINQVELDLCDTVFHF